jgi:hypothetical protein
MKCRFLYLYILLFSICLSSFAQDRCGFDEVHGRRMKTDSAYKKLVKEAEKSIHAYLKKNKSRSAARISTTTAALYTIPVVVHVVHTGVDAVGTMYNPSDAQIQGAIDYLNQVYNGTYPGTTGTGDIQIQFALAVRDPDCNPTNGIDRIDGSVLANYSAGGVNVYNTGGTHQLNVKNLSRWSPSDYYNIWVVNKIDGNDGTSGTFIGGFAYPPGVPQIYDGTIMLATQMGAGKKTLPHEIGHALGLYHPFEDYDDPVTTPCPPNTDCTSEGDYVCDTDPISLPAGFACRSGINPCTGAAYNSNTEENYMNYTSCYNLFTAGQKARMLAYAGSVYRASLSTSSALTPTNIMYPYSNPMAASCTPTTSATGLSGNYAGILNVQVNGKNFGSGGAGSDGGYLNGSSDCIKLISLTLGSTYSVSFNVEQVNIHQLRAWIDYNNDGSFDNSTEQIHYNSSFGNAQSFATSGNFTVPNTAQANTVLRMRVVNDLIPGYPLTVAITDACHNPYYGQAEDYAVYIPSLIVLPVNLLEFNGELKQNRIELNWSTVAENNSKDFEIEKSTDGNNFYLIGKTKAAGNSNKLLNYVFEDQEIEPSNFYRIRMNDLNGQSKLSKVILVNANNTDQSLNLLRNPFSETINIKLAKMALQIKLQLISIEGRVVSEKVFYNTNQAQWQLPGLNDGMYIIRAMIDGKEFSAKAVKQ